MKVITNNDYIQIECPHCGSTLGIYRSDIHVVEMCSDYVICDVCGGSFNIPSSKIPSHWRYELYKDFD